MLEVIAVTSNLGFNQIATVTQDIVEQATGKKVITPTDTSSFVSVGQLALATGYDNVMNAISQVLSRTIFSIRPYNRKFKGLRVTNEQYGNHVRKLQMVDKEFEDDNRQPLEDGKSVDMYTVNKPQALQTNFYGQTVFEKSTTIFRDQLDVSFRNPDEMGQFLTMQMTNTNDLIEQAHEGLGRGTIGNLMGGILAINNPYQVVHLLTAYNNVTGQSYDDKTIMEPSAFIAFSQWAYAYIATLSDMITERCEIYHQNITGKTVNRHTPVHMQKVFLYSPNQRQIESRVLADTYHDNYIRMASNETVNYWQSISSPNAIDLNVQYLKADGTLANADITQSNIFGLIMDEEAAGYTVVNEWSAPTPFNAKGGYSNIFWHFTDRYWNDFTENAILLLMD